MISVVESSEEPLENAKNNRELYLRLEDYLGQQLRVRSTQIERIGFLKRLSYQRQNTLYLFVMFAKAEPERVSFQDRVEVKLDGNWKVLNPGIEQNWEL